MNNEYYINRLKELVDDTCEGKRLDINELSDLLKILLERVKIKNSNEGEYFPVRLATIEIIVQEMKDVMDFYMLGDPEDEGYERRLRDITNFKENVSVFSFRVIELFTEYLNTKQLTELSKKFERKAFERT